MPAQAAARAGAMPPEDGHPRPPSRSAKVPSGDTKRESDIEAGAQSPLLVIPPPRIDLFPPEPEAGKQVDWLPPHRYAEGLTPELRRNLEERGLRPCSLREVLERRNKMWAKVQMISPEARGEKERLDSLFKQQCVGWGNNQEGWVYGKWNPVILCPDFRQGGLQVSRSGRRQLWECLKSVVEGFVDPRLQICEVVDPTHPVRFATPPQETCYTVVYVGPKIPASRKARVVFGEYTGVVKDGGLVKKRFEYVFDLSFSALAWRRAEEFETASDSSDDDCPSLPSRDSRDEKLSESPVSSGSVTSQSRQLSRLPGGKDRKKSVTVSGRRDAKGLTRVELPARSQFVLDSSEACNEMSLVNHYGTIELLGDCVCKRNSEWQQVFVDGWPHIVLTSIPGVAVEPGDEILADFGNAWFFKVQDASHEAIARELLEYRVGIRTAPSQKLVPARPVECVNRRSDPQLENRARLGEICPYCLSHEHRPCASSLAPSPSTESREPSKMSKSPEEAHGRGREGGAETGRCSSSSGWSAERKSSGEAATPAEKPVSGLCEKLRNDGRGREKADEPRSLSSLSSGFPMCSASTPSQRQSGSRSSPSSSDLLLVTQQLEREKHSSDQASVAAASPDLSLPPAPPPPTAVMTPQPKGNAEEKFVETNTEETGRLAPCSFSGDEVVHCDGCDRPCHLRCLPDPEAILNDWRWYCAVCRMRFFEMSRHLNYKILLSSEALASLEKEGILASVGNREGHEVKWTAAQAGNMGVHALAKTPDGEAAADEVERKKERRPSCGGIEHHSRRRESPEPVAGGRRRAERETEDENPGKAKKWRGSRVSKERSASTGSQRRTGQHGDETEGQETEKEDQTKSEGSPTLLSGRQRSRGLREPRQEEKTRAGAELVGTQNSGVKTELSEMEVLSGDSRSSNIEAPVGVNTDGKGEACSGRRQLASVSDARMPTGSVSLGGEAQEKENKEPLTAVGMEFLNVPLEELGKGSGAMLWNEADEASLSPVAVSQLGCGPLRDGAGTNEGNDVVLRPGSTEATGTEGTCSAESLPECSRSLVGKEQDVFSFFLGSRDTANTSASHTGPPRSDARGKEEKDAKDVSPTGREAHEDCSQSDGPSRVSGAGPLAVVTTTAPSSESDEDGGKEVRVGIRESSPSRGLDRSGAQPTSVDSVRPRARCHSSERRSDANRFDLPPVGIRERRAVFASCNEKASLGRMTPSRVEIVKGDLSSDELQGLQTLHLVDPKGLLGSLQPCDVCYKALGGRASTEVCRLAKRHLSPNWDHPHSTTPSQMKDAILTAFQEKVHSLQDEAKKRAQSVAEEIRQLKMSIAAKAQGHHAHGSGGLGAEKQSHGNGCSGLLCGSQHAVGASKKRPRGVGTAEVLGLQSVRDEKDCRPEDNLPAPLTSGFIPLIGVHLGKTVIDRCFNVGWFEGLITEYSAVAVEDGKWYANQFQVEYEDGDTECLKVEELVHLLAEHGIRHTDPATRHQYKTTTLDKLLSPEILAAKKELNLRFRRCKMLEEKEEPEVARKRKKNGKKAKKTENSEDDADGEKENETEAEAADAGDEAEDEGRTKKDTGGKENTRVPKKGKKPMNEEKGGQLTESEAGSEKKTESETHEEMNMSKEANSSDAEASEASSARHA
ncbi:putative histone lysine methyltransferase, SET [Toxoplasma gondii p89]|uniref:Putative histone lysine methyltransferase, SET n=2 Tax=Toxoplasma gondii TaxID=5811 RepID=A0A2T6IW85_TOXGO|nr:putative histone lysine methyltransferase, SET [Toxoplasma gondii p89]PUA89596.1 putative histone lysine methyltransferase, SET [Toxoplasma gondii TgCATBr9]